MLYKTIMELISSNVADPFYLKSIQRAVRHSKSIPRALRYSKVLSKAFQEHLGTQGTEALVHLMHLATPAFWALKHLATEPLEDPKDT